MTSRQEPGNLLRDSYEQRIQCSWCPLITFSTSLDDPCWVFWQQTSCMKWPWSGPPPSCSLRPWWFVRVTTTNVFHSPHEDYIPISRPEFSSRVVLWKIQECHGRPQIIHLCQAWHAEISKGEDVKASRSLSLPSLLCYGEHHLQQHISTRHH